jgi:hypothetical protein
MSLAKLRESEEVRQSSQRNKRGSAQSLVNYANKSGIPRVDSTACVHI